MDAAARRGAQGVALLAAAHVASYAYLASRAEPADHVFRAALSLARLGYLGPSVYAPAGPLHFVLPHLTSIFVNTSPLQCAANVAGAAWFGSRLVASPRVAASPLRALLGVYFAAGVAGAGYARSEHLAALQGWLRLSQPGEYARLVDAASGRVTDQAGLNHALALAGLDNDDTKFISFAPVFGALPATLGLASFTALDAARSRPMYAAGALPLLATALFLALQPAPDVPEPFVAANAALGCTTFGANAAGVVAGAACLLGHRLAARWALQLASRAAASGASSGGVSPWLRLLSAGARARKR